MKILLSFIVLLVSSNVFAVDSSWLVCKGKMSQDSQYNIVVNSLEHRSGPDERTNDLTLIFGSRLMIGDFKSSEVDKAEVILTTLDNQSEFAGVVAFDYQNNTLAIKGRLTLDNEYNDTVDATLLCEEMN